jgi:hypothetical protein
MTFIAGSEARAVKSGGEVSAEDDDAGGGSSDEPRRALKACFESFRRAR